MIPKLEVDGVSYSYHSLDGETLALDHISFDVSPGEFLAIVGPSGCGKSTLLSMLCGLTQPEGGTINIDGVPLTKSPSAIGYMLQKDHLFEWRNIFSNIALDYQTRLSVCDDISSIIRQTHKTAILVTHDLSEAISVADRILILSPRPGRVKKILSIDFPKMCTRSLDRRNCPEFSAYFNMVWKELKTYE